MRAEKANGVPIVLADATRVSALRALGIDRARMLVLAVNDTGAAKRIAQLAKQLHPKVHVIARAVYIAESEELKQRIVELEQPGTGSAPVEEEVETLARDLAEIGDAEHEVDTPFAWPEDDAGAPKKPSDGSGIGGYFDGLLSWDTKPE